MFEFVEDAEYCWVNNPTFVYQNDFDRKFTLDICNNNQDFIYHYINIKNGGTLNGLITMEQAERFVRIIKPEKIDISQCKLDKLVYW